MLLLFVYKKKILDHENCIDQFNLFISAKGGLTDNYWPPLGGGIENKQNNIWMWTNIIYFRYFYLVFIYKTHD